MQLNRDQYRHTHLSADELLNYLNDECWDHERHEIERHLLTCDLCAEALEGLENHSPDEINNDLEGFTKFLDKRTGRKKANLRILAIAASVSVLLISVFLGGKYYMGSEGESSLAMKESEVKQSPVAMDLDSIQSRSGEQLKMDNEVDRPNDQDENTADVGNNNEEIQEVETDLEQAEDTQASAELADAASGQDDQVLEEVVVPQKKVLDEAETEDMDMMIAADDTNEEMADEQVSNLAGQGARLRDSPAPAAMDLSEDVVEKEVSAESAQSLAVAKKAKVAVERSSAADITIEPEPVGGYAQFETYLRRNLRYPQEALDSGLEGTVVLKFVVEADGRVTQIEVEEGLGAGCDQEAIRLVAEGPSWTPGTINELKTKMPVSITVQFKISE